MASDKDLLSTVKVLVFYAVTQNFYEEKKPKGLGIKRHQNLRSKFCIKRNPLKYVFFALIIIDIIVILFLSAFYFSAFNYEFFKKEFEKHNIYSKLSGYNIDEIHKDTIDYVKNEKSVNLIDNDFYSDREKKHLFDVKVNIQKALDSYYYSIASLFLLFFCVFFMFEKDNLLVFAGRIFLSSGIFGLIVSATVLILFYFNFGFSFEMMHGIFFESGTYSFDPKLENIVNLYPEDLFFDLGKIIFVKTIIFSSILAVFGFVINNLKNFVKYITP